MEEIHYLLGNSCDLACDFCFWDKRTQDSTFDFKKRIIDSIVQTGIKKVTLSGGEPTINPHFIPVLEYMHERGLKTVVHTNGYSLDQRKVEEMSGLVWRTSLSIDAVDPNIQRKMRKKSDITERNLSLMNTLYFYQIPVNVKTLVTKVNLGQIEKIGKVLPVHIGYWSLLEFNPINRGKEYSARFSLNEGDFEKACRVANWSYSGEIMARRFNDSKSPYCFVNPNGQVYTYKENLGDVFVGSLEFENLKDIVKRIES